MNDVEIKESIRGHLAEMRKSAGLKQSELADKVGVTSRKYGGWERGETDILFSDAVAICDALGCDLNDLCGWWEWHDCPSGPMTAAEEELVECHRRSDAERRDELMKYARERRAFSEAAARFSMRLSEAV